MNLRFIDGEMFFMQSRLVKDTTREEREKIVMDALNCGDGCDSCSGCALGAGDPVEIYRPYIEGKMELNECTRAFNARYSIH